MINPASPHGGQWLAEIAQLGPVCYSPKFEAAMPKPPFACLSAWLAFPLVLAAAHGDTGPAMPQAAAAAHIRLDHLEPALQKKVADVLRQPTLHCCGPMESFPCRSEVYEWLLDHPHWGFRAWQALGARCASVNQNPDGTFTGLDAHGNRLHWQTIQAGPGKRVWYAEGAGRAFAVGPTVSVKAVVLLRFHEVEGAKGKKGVRQRTDVFACFDSTAAHVAARLLGMSTDSAAQKLTEQIGLFFSGMAYHLSEQPDWAASWLESARPGSAVEQRQLHQLRQILGKP